MARSMLLWTSARLPKAEATSVASVMTIRLELFGIRTKALNNDMLECIMGCRLAVAQDHNELYYRKEIILGHHSLPLD